MSRSDDRTTDDRETMANRLVDPDDYRYREDDWLETLRMEEAAWVVCERFGFSKSHFYAQVAILLRPYMRRRHGIGSDCKSILRFELEELIYRWKIEGFD